MQREQTWDILQTALDKIKYAREQHPSGRRFSLERSDESNYAVLYIYSYNPDTFNPSEMRYTRHEFVVPVATYNEQMWIRWVFDNIVKMELHEITEWFMVRDESKCKVSCVCKVCRHLRTGHDGRNSSCQGRECPDHRFVCEDGHYTRIYAPHHGNGWDPYSFWPAHDPAEKKKVPGQD